MYIGSFGRTLPKKMLKEEDMTFIYPKFKTNYNHNGYDVNGKELSDTSGDFLSFSRKDRADNEGVVGYSMYMMPEYMECVYENLLSKNDKKILLIGTSHARPYSAFLSLYVKDLHYFSMQRDTNYVSLYKYVEKVKPDAIVLLYSINSFYKNNMMNYHKGSPAKK